METGTSAGAIILVMPARQLKSVFNIYIQQRPLWHASTSERGGEAEGDANIDICRVVFN